MPVGSRGGAELSEPRRRKTGASRQILLAVLDRRFELLLSIPLMLEYEAVLSRPEHLAASGAAGLTGQTKEINCGYGRTGGLRNP